MSSVIAPECRQRIQHGTAELEKVQALTVAAEPSVRRHLTESLCCFSIGAYRAAIVAAWCGIEEHLRLILKSVGSYVYEEYRRDGNDKEMRRGAGPVPDDWHGAALFYTCIALQVLPGDSDDLKAEFKDLYRRRNECAHSSSAAVGAVDVLNYLQTLNGLVGTSTADQAMLQNPRSVVRAASSNHPLDQNTVRDLCRRLPSGQCRTLGEWACERVLSGEPARHEVADDAAKRESATPVPRKVWLRLWEAVVPLLSPTDRASLLSSMAAKLALHSVEDDPDEIVDAVIVWEDLDNVDEPTRAHVWSYLVSRQGEIRPVTARQAAARLPHIYRQQFLDALPQAQER